MIKTPLRVYHYTNEVPEQLKNRTQATTPNAKPSGLWVSDCDRGDGWLAFCESEQFRYTSLKNRLLIDLDLTDILCLRSVIEIDIFTEEYGQEVEFGISPKRYIRWAAVASSYKGILISPYQFDRRFDGIASNWYYGWDCASGCIWDTSAILSHAADASWTHKGDPSETHSEVIEEATR